MDEGQIVPCHVTGGRAVGSRVTSVSQKLMELEVTNRFYTNQSLDGLRPKGSGVSSILGGPSFWKLYP